MSASRPEEELSLESNFDSSRISSPSNLSASSFNLIQKEKLTEAFIVGMPLKSFPDLALEFKESLQKTANHDISKVSLNGSIFYYKKNLPGNPLSELEAVCAAYYRLISHNHAPRTFPIYNEKKEFIGVISEEIEDFASCLKEPITEDEIIVGNLLEKATFQVLDSYEKKLTEIELNTAKEKKAREKELKDELKKLEVKADSDLHQFNVAYKNMFEMSIFNDEILQKNTDALQQNINEKKQLLQEISKNAQAKNQFYIELFEKYHITEKEFENFRRVKGLAIGTTDSWIFGEADLHRNNMGKDGKRCDFDMSLWDMTCKFKKLKPMESSHRNPKSKISSHDILNFPELRDALPFYWPTTPPNLIATMTSSSHIDNAWPAKMNALFISLKDNPVFVHYKFRTLFKYILTNAEIYKFIAIQYLREDYDYIDEGQKLNLVNEIARRQGQRIQGFKDILTTLPEFADFIKEHGDYCYKEILEEFEETNKENTYLLEILSPEIQRLCEESNKLSLVNATLLTKVMEIQGCGQSQYLSQLYKVDEVGAGSEGEDGLTSVSASSEIVSADNNAEISQVRIKKSYSAFELNIDEDYAKIKANERVAEKFTAEERAMNLALHNEQELKLKELERQVAYLKKLQILVKEKIVNQKLVSLVYENIKVKLTNIPEGVRRKLSIARSSSSTPTGSMIIERPIITSASSTPAMPIEKSQAGMLSHVSNVFSFWKPGVNSAPKPPEDKFECIKRKVLECMERQLRPSFFLLSRNANTDKMALEIKTFCQKLIPASGNDADRLLAFKTLKDFLVIKQVECNTELRIEIAKLLQDDIWVNMHEPEEEFSLP